jgi:hypothetical protein
VRRPHIARVTPDEEGPAPSAVDPARDHIGARMRQPQTSQTVLVLADPSKRAYGHKSHAPDCRWVKGVKLAYVEVPASSVPSAMGRCSHCGGGR